MRESYIGIHRVVRESASYCWNPDWVLGTQMNGLMCSPCVSSLISNFLFLIAYVCCCGVRIVESMMARYMRENVSNSFHYWGWKVLNFHHFPWSRPQPKMWDTHTPTMKILCITTIIIIILGILIVRKLISLECSRCYFFSLPYIFHAPLFVKLTHFPWKLLLLDSNEFCLWKKKKGTLWRQHSTDDVAGVKSRWYVWNNGVYTYLCCMEALWRKLKCFLVYSMVLWQADKMSEWRESWTQCT